ncbi:MAG: hypothetical protein LBT74_00385 [Acidobacteriota bacterium]|nr:hypothetical protein [Acidobacteriota bacterium]
MCGIGRRAFLAAFAPVALGMSGGWAGRLRGEATGGVPLPAFGRDTVLVWRIEGDAYEKGFVARLGSFAPDRLLEWEDGAGGQGTVFLRERDLQGAKGYESSSLFVGGMDKAGRDATTLWLSRRVFAELAEKGGAKLNLDGVAAKLRRLGKEGVPVEVNRAAVELPVVKAADDRTGEWCFLDDPANPLMVRYETRHHRQTLASVTTDQPDTLRWIKGARLRP